jgi:hypothetical protein
MWHERGEPQTASALGAPVVLPGNCPIYDKSLAKDSMADYQYKGYTLSAGLPVFSYAYRQLKVRDQVQPAENGKGLKRSISITGEGKEKTMVRIAQANEITPLGKGLYSIGNQAYFVQIAPELYPRIETYLGQKLLVLPGSETVQYQLIW